MLDHEFGGQLRRILVVGDSSDAYMFRRIARDLGYPCEVASVQTALERALSFQPEVVVPDLGTVAADAVAWQIRCELRRPIYVTAIADGSNQRAVGVHARVSTPLCTNEIRTTLDRANTVLANNYSRSPMLSSPLASV